MTTTNLNLELNYKEGAGHFLYIYTVKGRAKTKKIYYEALQKFTSRERAEEYQKNLETNKDFQDLVDDYEYITISRDIVWID